MEIKFMNDGRICTSIELLKQQSDKLLSLGADDVYMLDP